MKLDNLYLPEKKGPIIFFFIMIGILTVFFCIGIINTEINNDVTVMLPINSETKYEKDKISRLGKEFSSPQFLFVGVKDDPFSLEGIKKFWELCRELESLKVVKSTMNPFNAIYFKKIGPTFSVVKPKTGNGYPQTKKQLEEFMKNITSNRYMIGSIISYDKKTAGIVIRPNLDLVIGNEIKNKNIFIKFIEFAFGKKIGPQKIDRTYFCMEIEKVLEKYKSTFNIYYAGVPVYEAKTKVYMLRDIFILIIPVFISMVIVFFINFRTIRGTILPITAILLSMTWTMGFIGWARYKLNMVGMLIPPLILTIGSSYSLHYLNSYYLHSNDFNDKRRLVIHASKVILPTIFFAAITTIAGFASFLTARIEPIRSFSIFIIISIILTLFFTFFLLSKILIFFDFPKSHVLENVIKKDFFSKILKYSRNLVYPLRFIWVGAFIACIVLFIIFIPKLKIDTNAVNFFKKGDRVRESLVFLQKYFHGTNHYNITIRSINNKKDYFKTKEGILAAKKIQDYLDNNVEIDGKKMIGFYFSPVTLLEDLNYVMTGKYDIPEDEKIITRFFSLLSLKSVRDEGIKDIINNDFSAITFQVRPHTSNTEEDFIMTEQELSKLTTRLETDLQKIAKEDGRFTLELWGEVLLLARIAKYLLRDQIWNITSTAIAVLIICIFIFRSLYFAVFSIIPLTFGVLMNFVIMSIFRIPLDVATVMIAAIAIGIGIDNSIHFILHYMKELKKHDTSKEAIIHTLSYTARPMLFTSLALMLGFMIFIFSSFSPIASFGILIAVSMLTCNFATIFILPAFLLISDKLRLLIHKKKN